MTATPTQLMTPRSFGRMLLALACGVLIVAPGRTVRAQSAIRSPHHEIVLLQEPPTRKIEFFWMAPPGSGPWPAIVFLHGHQEGKETPGGKAFVDYGVLDSTAGRGYIGISISQPGYGQSDGPPDLMGPSTIAAAEFVIRRFRDEPFVRADRVGLLGVSRGAVVASLLAARDSTIRAMVLISGAYDFVTPLDSSTSAGRLNISRRDQVRSDIAAETDGSVEALRNRSALSQVDRIRTPALILNGEKDDRTDPDQARRLAKAIQANGVFAQVVIYPEFGHAIPYAVRERLVEPFFSTYLK